MKNKLVLTIIIAFFFCNLSLKAAVVKYQGLIITDLPDFRTFSRYAYNYARVHVANHSAKKRKIKLYYSTYSDTHEVSTTFEIDAGETKEVSLYFPNAFNLYARLNIEVDGRNVGSEYGTLTDREFTAYSSSFYRDKMILFLDSAIAPSYFEDYSGGGVMPYTRSEVEHVHFNGASNQLYKTWQAYAQYTSIFYRSENFKKLEPEIKNAIFDYVRLGGVLAIIGNFTDIPSDFTYIQEYKRISLKAYEGVFGRLFVAEETTPKGESDKDKQIKIIDPDAFGEVIDYSATAYLENPSLSFSAKEVLSLGRLTILFLGILVAFLIGPLNVILLVKKKKLPLIFITTPVISLVICVVLYSSYYFIESKKLKIKRQALIFLDEKSNRAYTLAELSVFSARPLSEGMKFSEKTAVFPFPFDRSSRYRYVDSLPISATINLDEGQNFTRGWIDSRRVCSLHCASVENSRERVTFNFDTDKIRITNGLGADIKKIIYLSPSNKLFEGQNIPAGKSGELIGQTYGFVAGTRTLSDIVLYNKTASFSAYREAIEGGNYVLKQGQYLAILSGSPFFKQEFEKKADVVEEAYLIGNANKEGF